MVYPTTFFTFSSIHFESLLLSRIERDFCCRFVGSRLHAKNIQPNHTLIKALTHLHATFPSRVIRHVWIPNCILSACTTVSLEFGVWWSFKSIQNLKKTRQPKKLMWFSLHPPEEDGFSMHYSSSYDRTHALKSVRRNFLVFQREKRCDQKLFPLNY